MKTMTYRYEELPIEKRVEVSEVLEKRVREIVYHRDNVSEYYAAFGLAYPEDKTLCLRDILDYCEYRQLHEDWVEVLKWVDSFYIGLTLNLETFEIKWTDDRITERLERQIWMLLHQEDMSNEWIPTEDVVFYHQYETLIFQLLDNIQDEIRGLIWGSIDASLDISYQEDLYELEQVATFMSEDGQIIAYQESEGESWRPVK